MFTEEQLKTCFEEYLELPLNDSAIDFLIKHQKEEYFQELLEKALDVALDIIQKSFLKYEKSIINDSNEILTFIKIANLIPEYSLPYYKAVSCFFNDDKKATMSNIKQAIEENFFSSPKQKFTLDGFANCFIGPFKAGYPGFWDEIFILVDNMHTEPGVKELCYAVSLFYYSDNTLEIRSAIEKVMAIVPECKITKELLALSYFDDKMWGNAVAYFEQINSPIMFFEDYQYFMMGCCYGKLREKSNEINAYKKCVETYGEGSYALNFLGYAYYSSKQYSKALKCFKECIDYNIDIKYAVNNYARTLLAMKRFKDAKQFAQSAPSKLHKDILKKIEEAESTNKRISADKPIEELIEIKKENELREKIDFGAKKQQFTSEKILEDEIILRMERGLPVFGMNLKIYRRNGIYGRQYILSNGKRLDVLAEDDIGNLYIIELKKDSGYDDAYQQTLEYLEWFDANWTEKTKNIYGIICLNDPSEELINKVHKNSRMRVFEYQISYTER